MEKPELIRIRLKPAQRREFQQRVYIHEVSIIDEGLGGDAIIVFDDMPDLSILGQTNYRGIYQVGLTVPFISCYKCGWSFNVVENKGSSEASILFEVLPTPA